MNNINDIVFEIYDEMIDLKYEKSQSLFNKIKKGYRYLKSGYYRERKNNNILMNKKNEFVLSSSVYSNIKLCVYTVCLGGYDIIKNPIYVDSTIDYFIITDQELPVDTVWKKIDINSLKLDEYTKVEQTRYVKVHPEILFPNYDYSLYIDSNIRITCDVKPIIYTFIDSNKSIAIHKHQTRNCIYKESIAIYASGKAKKKDINIQINEYKKDGFPKEYGLFENNIIIRKHNDKDCINVMNVWWEQIHKFDTKRDQLSFMYSLWKNGFSEEFVFSLGNNSRRNPFFIVSSHK